MNSTDTNFYVPDDTRIVKWHINANAELDYTIYAEEDGGVLDLPEDYTTEDIEKLLEEELWT